MLCKIVDLYVKSFSIKFDIFIPQSNFQLEFIQCNLKKNVNRANKKILLESNY